MNQLQQAILKTVAYADVFQYPLTDGEIQRYLIGARATHSEVCRELESEMVPSGRLITLEGHYLLPGREDGLAERRRRRETALKLWPRALRYGKWIARLPFVRMVAVTGSLAMDNADSQADLDYLVVAQPGRVWLTRAMVILLVRLARQRGDTLCPNYFLSERALILPPAGRNLFTAHELVQMVPVSGADVLRGMWLLNGWICEYLPNAESQPLEVQAGGIYAGKVRPVLESLLRAPLLDGLERWEMERKIARFSRLSDRHPEASFGPDLCKGHFDDHGQRILAAYEARIRALESVLV